MALIAHWDFDGNSDKTGNGHDIDSSSVSRPFVGDSSSYYEVNNFSSLPESFSFEVRVQQDLDYHLAGSMWIGLNSSTGGNVFRLGVYEGQFFVSVNSGDDKRTEYPKGLSSLSNVMVSVDGTKIEVHFNGKLLHTHTSDKISTSNGRPLSIGQEWDTNDRSDFFKGKIWDIKYHEPALVSDDYIESYENDYYSLIGAVDINNPVFSNKETKQEANNHPNKVQFLTNYLDIKMIGKTGNYKSILDSNGEQRKFGYYQSTVLIDGNLTPNKRVLCFTNNGQLVDETVSDGDGVYRFDHLDLNKKYMFVAQYSNELNTPPDYTAVAADWQTPTPYKE